MRSIGLIKILFTVSLVVSSTGVYADTGNAITNKILTIFLADKAFTAQPENLAQVLGGLGEMKTHSKDDSEWILVSSKTGHSKILRIKSRYQAIYTGNRISAWSLFNHTLLIKDARQCFGDIKTALTDRLGKAQINEQRSDSPHMEWLVKEYYGVELSVENDLCKVKFIIYQGDGY